MVPVSIQKTGVSETDLLKNKQNFIDVNYLHSFLSYRKYIYINLKTHIYSIYISCFISINIIRSFITSIRCNEIILYI